MSSDIVVCNLQGEMGNEQFQVKCGGFRGPAGSQPRMTMLEFKYPDPMLVRSLYLCENDGNQAQYILDIDLVQRYLDKRVIELVGYFALQPFKDSKEAKGLAPKQIAAVLPVLKREYGIEYVILHAADEGSGKLVKHYETFGMMLLHCYYDFDNKMNIENPNDAKTVMDYYKYDLVIPHQPYMIGHIDHMIRGSAGRSPDHSFRTNSNECVGMNTFESLESEGCTISALETQPRRRRLPVPPQA